MAATCMPERIDDPHVVGPTKIAPAQYGGRLMGEIVDEVRVARVYSTTR